MGEFKLAIIIPAFKRNYLLKTLTSISKQTNKNFAVYIGDDASPNHLKEIIEPFSKSLNITYHRFDENFGGSDLVSQWNRCVALTRGEEFIWLFSDDDLMSEDCVQKFYNQIESSPNFDVYKFHTTVIDGNDKILYDNKEIDDVESSYNFLNKKLRAEINSYVTEYIFSRRVYKENGGFVNFPLAWCSDDATWALFGRKNGIVQLDKGRVYWRYSGENLSSNNLKNGKRKYLALIQFLEWSLTEFGEDAYLRESLKIFIDRQMNLYQAPFSIQLYLYMAYKLKLKLGIPHKEFAKKVWRLHKSRQTIL